MTKGKPFPKGLFKKGGKKDRPDDPKEGTKRDKAEDRKKAKKE